MTTNDPPQDPPHPPPPPGGGPGELAATEPPKKSRKKTWIIAGIGAAVVVVVVIIIAASSGGGSGDAASTNTTSDTPTASSAIQSASASLKTTAESVPATADVSPSGTASTENSTTDVTAHCTDIESTVTVTLGPDANAISGVLEFTYSDGDKKVGHADTGRVLMTPGESTFTVPTPATVATIWRAPGADPQCSVDTSGLRVATPEDLTKDSVAPGTKKPTTSAEPTTEEPTTSAAAKLPTKTYSGKGDEVVNVDLKGAAAIVTFTCKTCEGNTVLKSNGRDSLLVNEIGAYTGEHLIDVTSGTPTTKLTVKSDSSWTIKIADVSTAETVATEAKGHGDRVIRFTAEGTQATITNTKSESNFVVKGYGGNRTDLAVNEIGNYKGTVELTTPGFVQVESDGDWTIKTAP